MAAPLKDVGEYYDHAREMWEGHGCHSEPIFGPVFEYEKNAQGQETGSGHLLARIVFPEFASDYLAVEDWLEPRQGYIRRREYAYDLILGGARLENWHFHHGSYHRHDGDRRIPTPRVTLEGALITAREILGTWF